MSDHYYSNKPSVKSKVQELVFQLRGKDYRFSTDNGVFSKQRIDFGSVLLIESMDIPEEAAVLDVGCGYGPIGIVAADLANKGRATLVDVNERAVELANKNIKLNHLSNAMALTSNLYDNIRNQKFDRIVTNPPIRAGKTVVHQIFSEAYTYLNSGGQLWVVIQKKQGAPSAWEKMSEVFEEVEEVTREKGYKVFCAKKN